MSVGQRRMGRGGKVAEESNEWRLLNMKILLINFLTILTALASVDWTELERNREHDQAMMWQNELKNLQSSADVDKISKLKLGLRNIGSRSKIPGHSEEIDLVFKSIQSEIIKIHNHAKYLTEHLESIRISDADGGRNTSENDRNRYSMIIETMVHLQSPEIIQVLGNYLYDERDTPPPPTPHQDWADTPANSYLSAMTLSNIGIKNAPVPKGKYASNADLATWRLWWEQVQAGNRTFSFEGQDIEFRLKKSGEIERLTPSDTSSLNHSRNSVPATAEAVVTERGGNGKVFIISAICLLTAAVFFHFRRKNSKV